LLDRSYSMNSVLEGTIGGFNTFIDKLKSEQSGVTYVGLTLFDAPAWGSTAELQHVFLTALGDTIYLDKTNYAPRGNTPLYDALATDIYELREAVKNHPTKPNVLYVIITDGEENGSKKFDANTVKGIIKEVETEGWTFTYLGANQDSWQIGSLLGMSAANTVNYATSNMNETFAAVATASNSFRSESTHAKSFSATAAYASDTIYQDAKVDTSALSK